MNSEVVKNILLVGPCTERTKGGMATVIKSILNDDVLNKRFHIEYVVSHAEIAFLPKFLLAIKALGKICFEHRNFEVLHLHVADGASFYRKGIMAVFAKMVGMKVIFHLHAAGFDNFYSRLSWFGRKFASLFFHSSSKIVVLSEFWKKYLIEEGVTKNIIILSNSINTNMYKRFINPNCEFLSFLFLGRLCKRKGIYDLLEVINKLKNDKNTTGIKFFVAGDGDIEGVSRLVNHYGLKETIHVLGWVDDHAKIELLKKVDFIVLPSYEEALPMSLLEGLASGKILISTNIGGIPDLISDGVNGFLLKPGDQNGLFDTFIKIGGLSKDCLIEMSVNNVLKAHSFYDIEIIRKNLIGVYLS